MSEKDRKPDIHRASEDGDLEAVVSALTRGCPADLKWQLDYTPLQLASLEGHLEVVKALLDHGADVNLRDGDTGMAALHNASVRGHVEICRLLIDNGAVVDTKSEDGFTPLIDSAGNVKDLPFVTKVLLESGACVNHQAVDGTTALHEAARAGALNIVRVLLENGADKQALDSDGNTPSDIAVMNDHLDLATLLTF